jgi:hypothetical protein
MATHEPPGADRAKVLAAAHAAAAWARARRAAWTNTPLAVPAPRAAEPPPRRVEPAPEPEPVPVASGPGVHEREEAREWFSGVQEPAVRWGPRLAAAAALAAAVIFGGPYIYRFVMASKSRLASSSPTRPAPAPPAPVKQTGTLVIRSTPDGARVTVDGASRGTTPVTLDDVAPGRHTVVLQSSAGSIERTIAIAPNGTAEVDEPIFSGFLTIYAPFELTVSEGPRVLHPDDRNQLMLPPGRHDLRLANRALGYEEVHRVDLKPGQKATLSITPPKSAITITANEAGEVWIDGTRIGDAPVTNAPIDLGTHDVVVKRAAGGERRFTVTATTRPALLSVDFSKP